MSTRAWIGLTIAGILSVACDRLTPGVDEERTMATDVRAHVSGPAASNLRDGGFRLAPARAPDDVAIISTAQARDLAAAFLRTWGHSHQPVWESQRGAPINVGTLRLSPETYFALTPHARFPDGYHRALRRAYGPWYILHFRDASGPVLGVAVSAHATDLRIEDGLVRQPEEGGNYFATFAVPLTSHAHASYHPLSPEEAVVQVATATGARITEVPILVRRAGWHPLLSLWHLTLDRPVQVRPRRAPGKADPAAAVAVREIYCGPGGALFIPSPSQAPSIRMAGTRPPPWNAGPRVDGNVELPRRANFPVDFQEVESEAGRGQ